MYLAAGYGIDGTSNKVLSLNLNSVNNLSQAQSKSWLHLGDLTESIEYANVQFYEDQLFIIGYYGSGKNLQVYDLNTKDTEVYSSVYSTYSSSGVKYAGSWISNGNLTIFGGDNSKMCYQQSGVLSNPGGSYWGDSCDNTKIEGTVIGTRDNGHGREVNYANILK